jgi:hypothetical protein
MEKMAVVVPRPRAANGTSESAPELCGRGGERGERDIGITAFG